MSIPYLIHYTDIRTQFNNLVSTNLTISPHMVNKATAMNTYVSLQEWADKKFGHVPTSATLSRYAKNGQIYPKPVKFGGRWRVDPEAQFLELQPANHDTSNPLLRKILNGG